jgi:RNA-binding protein with serine-rich domain 1
MQVDAAEGAEEEGGHRVIVISGLTKNVHRGHLEEIFGVYGKVTGADVPVFKICEFGSNSIVQ